MDFTSRLSIGSLFRPPLRGTGWMALLSAVLTAGLITYGGWVRASGSGLGCPDWPLCQGAILPLLEGSTAIEFGHRVFAGVTMVSAGVATFLGFRARHASPLTWRLLIIAMAVLAVQALVGGITVLTELHGMAVVVHLTLAMASLTLLTGAALSALQRSIGAGPGIAVATALLLLGAIAVLGGSSLVGTGYNAACPALPLCDDRTALGPGALHLLHRLSAGLLVVALLSVGALLHSRGANPLFVALNHGVALLITLEITVGILSVSFTFPEGLRVLHLGLAALIWWGLSSTWLLVMMGRKA